MAITIKTQKEIALLRDGGRRLAKILREVEAAVRPGRTAAELNALAERMLKDSGDVSAFLNYKPYGAKRPYPAVLCVSVNDEVVHGIPNESEKILKEGDIVSLDMGLIHKGFYTDMAVTVPVGAIDAKAVKLLNVTKEALAKGIAAIAIPGVAVILFMAVRRQFFKILSEMDLAAGALVFSAIVLPWFIQISLKKPEFIKVFFFHEHWTRFISSEFEHQEPWYYYFAATPILLVPWVLFPAPLVRGFSVLKEKNRGGAPLFLWMSGLGLIVFFSLSRAKLPTYILPSVPLFCTLFGYTWAHAEDLFSKKWAAKAERLFYAMILAMVVVSFPVAFLIDKFNKNYTTKPFAETLRPRLKADDPVFIYDHPGPFYDFRFYLDHPVRLIGLEGEFRYLDEDLNARLAKDEKESWITREEFYEMLKQGKKLYCLIRKSDFSEMDPEIRKRTLVLNQDERKILFQTKP